MPTRCPCSDSATASAAVTVDLPTPPFPEQTASTRVDASSESPFERPLTEPRSLCVSACRSSADITSKPSWTSTTPSSVATSRRTWSSKLERSGQPATVSAIVTRTCPPSISTERTMSSSVTGRCSSGSMTRPRASRTTSRLGISRISLAPRQRAQRARAAAAPPAPCEEVAVLRATVEHDAHRELARLDALAQLIPAERRREGRARLRTHRIGGGDGLSPPVLTVIDEHPFALALQPLGRDEHPSGNERVFRFVFGSGCRGLLGENPSGDSPEPQAAGSPRPDS